MKKTLNSLQAKSLKPNIKKTLSTTMAIVNTGFSAYPKSSTLNKVRKIFNFACLLK